MWQLVIILKALNEVALVALLGQGVLYVLAGTKREQNLVYALFRIVTSPVMKLTRWITPRFVLDRHLGLVAMFLLLIFELVLIIAKVYLVRTAGA